MDLRNVDEENCKEASEKVKSWKFVEDIYARLASTLDYALD